MKPGILINIIKAASNDNDALRKLAQQPTLKKLTILPSTVANNTSALCEAAKRGYSKVLKHLIEVKGANPEEEVAGKMALEFAILGGHLESAVYLTGKMTNFVRHQEGFCLPLLLAIERDQLEVVKAILCVDNTLIAIKSNADKRTLLIDAIVKGSEKTITYLLENGPVEELCTPNAQGHTAFECALDFQRDKIIDTLLGMGASSISCNVLGEPISPLYFLLNSLHGNEIAQKRKCINVLLAAGAGLDISKIPDKVFTLLNLDKAKNANQLGPFLIVAEQKQADGSWKNKMITQIHHLKQYLNSPDWRFKTTSLACATLHPKIKDLEHVQLIQSLLPANSLAQAQSLPQFLSHSVNLDYYDPLENKKIKENITLEDLQSGIQYNLNLFKAQSKNLTKYIDHSEENEIDRLYFEDMLKCYFKRFSNLIDYLNYPKALEIFNKSSIKSIHAYLVEDLISHHKRLTQQHTCALNAVSLEDKENALLLVFKESVLSHLSSILKKKPYLIKQNDPKSYSDFKKLIASFYFLSAQQYLALDQELFAVHDANEAIECIEDAENSDLFQSSVEQMKSDYLFILACAYLNLGWIDAANETFKNALKLCENSSAFSPLHNSQFLNIIGKLSDKKIVSRVNEVQILGHFFHMMSPKEVATLKKKYSIGKSDEFSISLDVNNLQPNKVKALLISLYENKKSQYIEKFENKVLAAVDHQESPHIEIARYLTHCPCQGIVYDPIKQEMHLTQDFAEIRHLSRRHKNWLDKYIRFQKAAKLQEDNENQVEQLAAVTQQLSDLSMDKTPKTKTKTRGTGFTIEDGSSLEEKEEGEENEANNHGFTLKEGYCSPMPVTGSGIPNDTLYLCMPTHDAYLPFHQYVRDKEAICSIPKFGRNQQGVKFGTSWTMGSENKKTKVCTARMKILGADGIGKLRATGQVQQEVRTPDGRMKKLYVLENVVDKKQEKRSGYRF